MLHLSEINPHPRDKNIKFYDKDENGNKVHIYELILNEIKIKPVSTTETIGKFHEHFDDDKTLDSMFAKGEANLKPEYRGMTREQIKAKWKETGTKASESGTAMHEGIENFFNGEEVLDPNSKEHQMFLNFWRDYLDKNPGHKAYRTEWLIYDDNPNCKHPLSGSIDFVVEDENGDLHLFDWKRSKDIKKSSSYTNRYGKVIEKKMKAPFNKLDDCNFYKYSLQLNFYRHVLETQYDKKVKTMTLVILHPNQDDYITHEVTKIELDSIWHTLH